MTDLGIEGGRIYKASGIKSEGRKNRRTMNDMEVPRKALREILEADHPQTVQQVYHLGDSDRAARMRRATLKRSCAGTPPTLTYTSSVSLLNEQIERWDLPIRPNKPGNSRTKKFHRQEGSVELDAIPARELRKLVRDCIMEHVDEDLHARLKTLQEGEQRYLKQWPPLFQQGHGWGLL